MTTSIADRTRALSPAARPDAATALNADGPGAAMLPRFLRRCEAEIGPLGPDGWTRLADAARRHNVGPFLYRHLERSLCDAPLAIVEQFHHAYLEAAASSLSLQLELGRILHAYRARAIQVIPLKGACLAEAAYDDAAFRPMVDLDLLVRPADLTRAIECLRGLGYDAEYNFDPAAEQAISHHMPAMSGAHRVPVELHWTIACPGFSFQFSDADLDGVWARSLPKVVAGAPCRIMAPTDLLLHLCLHVSSHHRFDGVTLLNFLDIAEVCRQRGDAIDWDSLAARAQSWGVANGVSLALRLAQEWTGAAVEPHVFDALHAEPADETAVAWAGSKVLAGTPYAIGTALVTFETEETRAGKLMTIWRHVFLPRAEMARIYADSARPWRLPACYLVRLRDLWRRYRCAMWKIVRRDKQFVADARKEARLREYLGWR